MGNFNQSGMFLLTTVYTQCVGWSASAVLLATIVSQLHRQWKAGTSKGVSQWLFIGQAAASMGFAVYSWLLGDVVFIATNILMLIAAVVGLNLLLWHRKKNPSEAKDAGT